MKNFQEFELWLEEAVNRRIEAGETPNLVQLSSATFDAVAADLRQGPPGPGRRWLLVTTTCGELPVIANTVYDDDENELLASIHVVSKTASILDTEARLSLTSLAKDAYERYCKTTDWKNYQGLECPQWWGVTPKIRSAWRAAVQPFDVPVFKLRGDINAEAWRKFKQQWETHRAHVLNEPTRMLVFDADTVDISARTDVTYDEENQPVEARSYVGLTVSATEVVK